MSWRVFAAAAIGKSHIDSSIPCQDAFAHALVDGTLVAVVCDGAGSHAMSHEGAAMVSARVVNDLSRRVGGDGGAADIEAFRAIVVDAVASARGALEARASAENTAFADYSCTLVGLLAHADGGFFFHIGDGLGVARGADAADCALSLPENGEYANETYFVTGEAWQEHLRVAQVPHAVACAVLMSDGAMPFVMAKGNGALYAPFMDPVERFLSTASEDEGSAALLGTLADPRTYRITSDDKTLLIALRQ
jgi:hypothetical protein